LDVEPFCNCDAEAQRYRESSAASARIDGDRGYHAAARMLVVIDVREQRR
jgi:hypothetical protein